jgi:hypothetical protein
MKYAGYLRIEQRILASNADGIVERWRFGRRLIEDGTATTPAGNMRHGELAKLLAKSKSAGYRLSEREIGYRLQCAKAYPTEAQIRTQVRISGDWTSLREAGFPPVEMPDEDVAEAAGPDAHDDLPAGPDEQLALFPAEQFTRLSTLGELAKYADEQREYTEHMAARDARRYAYLQLLIAAVGGDMSATWEDAQQALDATP